MIHKNKLLFFKLFLSIITVSFVLRQIKINNYTEFFFDDFFKTKTLLFSIFLYFIMNVIVAIRWFSIINYSNKNFTFFKVLRACLYSNIFTSFSIPALSDISRIAFLGKSNLSKKNLAASVIIDRSIGLFSKIIYTIIVLVYLIFFLNIIFLINYLYVFISLLLMLIFIFYFYKIIISYILSKISILKNAYEEIKNNFQIKYYHLLYYVFISVFIHLILALIFFIIIKDTSVPNKIIISLLSPILLIVTQIPLFIGGWGIRELTFVSIFTLFSIAGTISLSVSIYFGIISTLFSISFLFLWLIESFIKKNFYL